MFTDNLGKACSQGIVVSKVVENTGEMVRARSMMYNAMVHTVLLYR